ncbi:anti-sigma factor family protein [Sanguibacter suaedae]|uniref:Zf-HC2 domain-containing protein n=1 Tax=Sanguibacter suaedae TaxID=2795737 RepID=A0A934IAI4_9MICO|nr:zf-HC2 domain-containing protein [Sanguibacter suaedae]MBI9115175.1 zf-HC2 domain-containing protein [Sanguibacter suaedae]
MTSHLGSRISAVVDGQLAPDERERALAHVAACDDCADELRAAREAHRALTCDALDVIPDSAFVSRLLAMSCEPEGSHEAAHAPPRRAEPWRQQEPLPPRSSALCGDVAPGRWWVRGVALSAAAATGVAAAGLFVLGSRPLVVPARHPVEALAALAAAPSVGDGGLDAGAARALPVGGADAVEPGTGADDLLVWMQQQGWPCPSSIPDSVAVTQVRYTGQGGSVLEVDLESPVGRIVVREQKGQLELSAIDGLPVLDVVEGPVYVLSDEPLHLVWQSSDTVVDLVAEADGDDVLQLVSSFTVDEFDTGFQARVGRGWSTLTGVLS